MDKSRRNSLATLIYDCAREVHAHTGPGILPEIFKSCLAHELRLRGMRFRMNAPIAVQYKGIRIEEKLFADFIIEEEIAVELITSIRKTEEHQKKLNTVVSFSGCSMGVLLNPSEERLIDGFKKITNLKRITL
jgi:GxxExxY protein